MDRRVLQVIETRKSNRRTFVQKLGMAGVAASVASALVPSRLEADPSSPTDADILNFALNLEFLEAEFYTVATTGLNISQFGIIDYGTDNGSGTNGGATTGGAQVHFTDIYTQMIAEELALDERAHVAFLQNVLGLPIAKPAINLDALGFGFGSQAEFLTLARIFEDIGVTAYGGAAPLIASKSYLAYAARILATEAEHAGAIRLLIAQQGIASPTLDGADVPPPPSGSQFFSLDSSAFTQTRTPGQVLYLAYGAPNATSGGFFPAGVNGNLVTSASAAATTDSATFVASPNPIPVAPGTTLGATTITWSAPAPTTSVQIHMGVPTGPLVASGGASGSMATGVELTNGMLLLLQDVTNGAPLIPQHTLAVLTVRLSS